MQPIVPLYCLLGFIALSSQPAQAQWSTDSLSKARMGLAGVTVDNYVLFAGGNEGFTNYGEVDIYDANTDLWSEAALSVPRNQTGATAVGSLALFAGGIDGAVSDVVDVFDAQSGTWSVAKPLSIKRFGIAATTVGTKAFFAGGSVIGVGGQTRVDIYDASLGAPSDHAAWSTAELSLGRGGAAAVTVGDLAIFAGGAGFQGQQYDRVDIYDNTTGSWSEATLSVARHLGANAGAVVGTRAYFGGGHFSLFGGPNMSDAVDVFDASTGLWSAETLSVPRGNVGVTAIGNSVLFAGGRLTGFAPTDLVDTFNVGTGEWTTTPALSVARSVNAQSIGGKALFAGGQSARGVSAVVDCYEPVGLNYCAATVNSTGVAATIHASGSPSLAANDLVLQSVGVPLNSFIFFHGPAQAQVPFGDGFRCVGGGLTRISAVELALNGVAEVAVDLTAAGITTSGMRNFQCWFRDPGAGMSGFNTSDAIGIEFGL